MYRCYAWPKVGFLCFLWMVEAFAEPDIQIYSENSDNLATGVPFNQWLHHVVIEIPKPPAGPFGNPLQLSGGNCSSIRVDRSPSSASNVVPEFVNALDGLHANDLTSVNLSPAFGLHLAASLRCTVLVQNGALRIGFALQNATADLAFAVQPVTAPGSQFMVPLGKVEVTRCSVSFVMSMLRFEGSSMLNSALTQFEPALKNFINEELPLVACSQLEPILEKQASAALSAVLVQLEPFLTSNPNQLPAEPAANPAIPLVDWGTYPPACLLRALIESRPDRVAGIIRRTATQQIPLNMLGINRSVTITALGTTLRSYTKELKVGGFDTFVEGSLSILGNQSHVWSSASFQQLTFAAKLQAQIRSVDPHRLQQDVPLLEDFEVSLRLGNVKARAQTLAMVSREALDSMEVDQFQDFGCLVSSARGCALGLEAPMALQRLQLNLSQPAARVRPEGSLDEQLAEVATTLLKVILSGYVPSLEQVIQSSVTMLHHAMNEVVKQVLDTTPPCKNTEVYFGPAGLVNLSLLLLSSLLALSGLGALLSPQLMATKHDESDEDSLASDVGDLPLARHPVVPPGLARAYPFLVAATMFLFVFSDLGLGTVVNIVFHSPHGVTTLGPAFSFSVLTLSRDSLKGGAWLIAILVIGLSGVWPFVKLGMLLYSWLTPPSSFKKSQRGRMLVFLDEYGKYSLVDSWLAILALCAFDLKWNGRAGVNVTPVPMLPFFTFVIASVVSLILGHIATVFHRRAVAAPGMRVPRSVSRDLREEQPSVLFNLLPRQQSWQLLGFAIFNAGSVLVSSFLTSIRYEVSGVIADLLLEEQETHLAYSLVSLGAFLTSGFEASNGLRSVQAIFFIFTLVIPLALVGCLLSLLLIPLKPRDHVRLLKVCHVLDAWAAFDVFVLAVVVAHFEFWLLTEFLMYHDNIGSACSWIRENLHSACLAMECHVQLGFILMAMGGVSSYLTPKLYFRYCHNLLEEEMALSESEEELLRK